MPYETLLVDQADAVATVTLNRPAKRNAINGTMFEELGAAFASITANASVRSFVLKGAGVHFCSGVDLSAIEELPRTPEEMRRRMDRIHALLGTIMYCPKPGIAAVRGYAAGGGANLALACDLVVMGDDARFSELFVRRGLVMDMSGTFTLPRSIGLHRAKELALLGDTIDAVRAYEMGIANRVVPAVELDSVVRAMAAKLAAGPPVAMALMKRAINDAFSRPVHRLRHQRRAGGGPGLLRETGAALHGGVASRLAVGQASPALGSAPRCSPRRDRRSSHCAPTELIHETASTIGAGVRRNRFSLPTRSPTTRLACSSSARCLAMAWRETGSTPASSVAVIEGCSDSRRTTSRRVGSASALNTASAGSIATCSGP